MQRGGHFVAVLGRWRWPQRGERGPSDELVLFLTPIFPYRPLGKDFAFPTPGPWLARTGREAGRICSGSEPSERFLPVATQKAGGRELGQWGLWSLGGSFSFGPERGPGRYKMFSAAKAFLTWCVGA